MILTFFLRFRIETSTADELNAVKIIDKLKLDIDDALQVSICEKYNLKII